jgi:hypothetical protein
MRGVSILLIMVWLAAVASASITPVRADVTSVAVIQFQNDANAPAAVVNALSDALYRAVATSVNFTARGGGPIAVKPGIDRDPGSAQFQAAAKTGAEHMLIGDVVAYGGGSVTFRLEAWRVTPMGLVRTRTFTQSYPPANGEALVAALGADVAALEAPRAGTATIFAIKGNEIDADVGSADGFHVDQRFNVVRNGQKVADATIVTIYNEYGVIGISNPAARYKPAVGDRLVSQESRPALLPATTSGGGFNPLYFIVAAAAVLLGIAHNSNVGPFPSPSPVPSGSGAPFTVSGVQTGGSGTALPIWTFTFSQSVSSTSQAAMTGDTTSASWTITRSGITSSPATLGSLGPVSFSNSFTLVVQDNNVAVNVGDTVTFFFTANVTSSTGSHLTPNAIAIMRISSAARQPLTVVPAPPNPADPAVITPPQNGAPKLPGTGKPPNPAGGASPHDPRDPHDPH